VFLLYTLATSIKPGESLSIEDSTGNDEGQMCELTERGAREEAVANGLQNAEPML
jgi:hypothetical protein